MSASPKVASTTLPNTRAMFLVLGAFAASALLHVDRVPPWCAAVAAIALLWHSLFLVGRLRLPATALRLLMAATLFAATLASFRTVQGIAAGSALLLVMGAAKLLEIRQRRDAMVVAFVSLVLLLAACLDRQSLARMPLYLLAGWCACAAIAALGEFTGIAVGVPCLPHVWHRIADRPAVRRRMFRIGAAPARSLWSLPGGDQAHTGLDDQMSPGSISQLSASDSPAFRARFEGLPPPASARYWRGPVLHDFDGYTWRRTRGQIAPAPASEARGREVRYHVMLEPHGRNWLYGLDTIREISGQFTYLTFDGQVMSARPVDSLRSYDGAIQPGCAQCRTAFSHWPPPRHAASPGPQFTQRGAGAVHACRSGK